jgi:REP element-mobilizing transposase RayT
MNTEPESRLWYGRGYLPHYDDGSSNQFLTIRLADSIPLKVLDQWEAELKDQGEYASVELRKRIEKYLDKGYGECHLRKREIAVLVKDSLYFHHENKYLLKSWVIMPNHVHILLQQMPGIELEEITHSLKSYTALKANRLLGRSGEFWQTETYDRYIRDAEHYDDVVNYIERNPVKARLCRSPEEWEFGSAWIGSKNL